MARYQLLLPKMGESVAEATIIKWNKNTGDYIEADEAVMEIATDKVDSEVPSPVSGKLIQQLCSENEVVQVGAVIAIIETEGDDEAPAIVAEPQEINLPEEPKDAPVISEPIPGIEQLEVKASEESKGSGRFYSPLVKNIAAQEGISIEELDKIPGTGAEGRLTKDDLLNYLQSPSSLNSQTEPQQSSYVPPVQEAPQPKIETPAYKAPEPIFEDKPFSVPAASASGRDEIIEMDRMRRLIADHMVMSKHTSPHVTSFVEADVTNLVLWREKVKGAFEKKEGEKITFTPIFIEAVVRAIKDMPMINVSVNGYQIIKKAAVNIGMATALPSGNLIVPVIKNADKLNLIGLTKSVNDLANRARNNKLQPDDVKDGTFTITNVGSFGNVMGTPIINQPQAAILAVGAIKKKPAVIETKQGDMIAIRHMMFLSLSYDHRVVDGALGGSFLRRVADYLEQWDLDRAI
ncbi:dihydrolipoamide acetyltransferase family protein [Mucilaginibacter sp. BT774]|uniref:dihydrolipoamide acetyltransferase family protein n=1 Tax=Mucilaginibacter sp. BT774 TaxID=3062276 RepID=UPI00267485C9|nr:dihydrolipoamide acetyltransferase family protein [Mucilaginibacter sp. BT774]MDO3625389.1 dihydrolipoamide acetyltransferase family protein [Mucilaginibacter sp. BT774]